MNARNEKGSCDDVPTYSRLFVVCDRKTTQDQLHDAFSKFGVIEETRMPRNRNTGESKGIAFIKFSKTSEAAAALEEMNMKTLPGITRPLKVMVASNRSDIQTVNDEHDDEKFKRLFIYTSKTATQDEIADHFNQFGKVISVIIQRDRNTQESKGFAYVKYKKFSEAANAFESCDDHYKAIFAQPKGYNRRPETHFESNINNLAESSANMGILSMMNTRPRGFTRIMFMCSPFLNQRQVEQIFNIVPGMAMCQYFIDYNRNCGKGRVSYTNPISAAYAVEKIDKIEYPPGSMIFVKPDDSKFDTREQNYPNIPNAVSNLRKAISTNNSGSPDLAQLAEAVAEASKLIKMATVGISDDIIPDSNDLNYCSVKLPPPQPLADIDSTVAKRCFLVGKPQPPPPSVLRDVFCRFGDLINVYTLPNKTIGYARYASVEGANKAMEALHGAEICGVRMKVIEAEDEAPPKRMRFN